MIRPKQKTSPVWRNMVKTCMRYALYLRKVLDVRAFFWRKSSFMRSNFILFCLICTTMIEILLWWTQNNTNKFKNKSVLPSFLIFFRPERFQDEWTKSNQLTSHKHNAFCWKNSIYQQTSSNKGSPYTWLNGLTCSEAATEGALLKTGVLRNFEKFSGKHLCPATLLKKRLWHRCFPVNFAKCLRTPFSQNTSGRLLLHVGKKCKCLAVIWNELSIFSTFCLWLLSTVMCIF